MKEQRKSMQHAALLWRATQHYSLVRTDSQDANTHGSVYGGWLLRACARSARAAMHIETGKEMLHFGCCGHAGQLILDVGHPSFRHRVPLIILSKAPRCLES